MPPSTPAAGAAPQGAGAGPIAPPQDLTIPLPASSTARQVLSLALRRVIRELLHAHDRLHGAARYQAEVHAMRTRIVALAKDDPGLLAHLARLPTVGASVRCLRRAGPEGLGPAAAAIQAGLSATLALELAFAGALVEPLRLTRFPPRIVALSARCVLDVPAGATALVFEAGRVRVMGPGGETVFTADHPALGRPYHPIDAQWVLAESDNNPLAMEEAHPDKSGNAIDLGGRRPADWVAALTDALALVGDHLPDLREEMRLLVQQVVPVGYDAERHLSASYQEALGTIYLTLHPAPMTMTEALIHEFSHNKLNALLEIDAVLENAFHPLFTSPVRPDPRPLQGILLAVHAFVPVARLYEKMTETGHPLARRPEFQTRYRKIVAGNRDGIAVLLEHARPTHVGRGLLDELSRWETHFEKSVASPP